jgi:hypothetical protein
MAQFSFLGRSIDLPAVQLSLKAITRDRTAWQDGQYITVRLIHTVSALRVHTNGRSFPGRDASAEPGAWVLVGDVIHTASTIADTRSLPVQNPTSMVAFTHSSEASIAANTVLNIGLASAKFGGSGGGYQAEYVSGPAMRFTPLVGKHWHGRSGNA